MSNNPQNAFITSVAILLVLVTLYFTTNALKRNYEIGQQKIYEENRQRELEREQKELIRKQQAEKELQRQADILARLKEHEHYCYDLQIFTLDASSLVDDVRSQEIMNEVHRNIQILEKSFRSKSPNKSQQPKKANSTEPIIYLFVLVLLYLLLRAASDITQHYKEQSKGDKRNNRRCSLQVYAQMKNDRRSSKGICQNYSKTWFLRKYIAEIDKKSRCLSSNSQLILKIQKLSQIEENRLLTMNSRSKSVDRPILQRSKRIYPKLRSYTSVDERPSCSSSTTVLAENPAENIFPMNLVIPSSRPKSLFVSDITPSRRCSVPALSLQQLGMLNRRRTSIGTLVEEDPLGLETKKRHRMIQRH